MASMNCPYCEQPKTMTAAQARCGFPTVHADWDYDKNDPRGSWEALLSITNWWPGVELSVRSPFPGYLELSIVHVTQDSRHPNHGAKISHRKPLPEHAHLAGPRVMEDHIRRCLREVAVHEADEWLTIGTRRPYDPHHVRGAIHEPV